MAYPPGRELNLGYVFFGNGHAKEFLPLIHDDIHSSIGHRQIFPPECSSTLASCGWRWPCQVSWRLFPAHYGGGWLRWLNSVYAGHTSTSEAELKVAQPSRSEPLLQLRWLASQRETLILSYPDQISQIRHGKSTISQPALIVSDPVQISQIRHGKSPLSQPALIVSDPVQISQICYGKFIPSLHADMPTCLNWACLILSGLNRSDPVWFCKFVTKGREAAQNVFLRVWMRELFKPRGGAN